MGEEASPSAEKTFAVKGKKRQRETEFTQKKKQKIGNGILKVKSENGEFKKKFEGDKGNKKFGGGQMKKKFEGGKMKKNFEGGQMKKNFEGGQRKNFEGGKMKKFEGGKMKKNFKGGQMKKNFKGGQMKNFEGGQMKKNFEGGQMKKKFDGKMKKKFEGGKRKAEFANKEEGNDVQKKPFIKEEGADGEKESPEKKVQLFNMKKKERLVVRKKNDNEQGFERGMKLKLLWEDLRKESCKPAEKERLLEECSKLIKGHAKELSYAHDTVRVLECVFSNGNEEHKSMLFEELKEVMLDLAKSKYGKFFMIKVLQNGSKTQKNAVISQFHGKVVSLISHAEAASVVEVAFNECANATQRAELVQEFYGPSYRFFKESNCHSLTQILEKVPEQKQAIIQNMTTSISKLFEKSVIRHSIVHYLLHEFLLHADSNPRSEMIEVVRPHVVEMLHTKDGARSAMRCIWHGTSKDRKIIVKSFKTHVCKIAKEEHGHMVLLALFDCVDDTKLLEKHIISELKSNLSDIVENPHGRKVLVYLMTARDSVHFHPDIIRILEEGDKNTTSKKDSSVRRAELKETITAPVVSVVAENVSKMYSDNASCIFITTVVKNADDKEEVSKAIAKLASVVYTNETKNTHIIESPGSSFMLKKLILADKEQKNEGSFSELFTKEVTDEAMKSWILCNRGCFNLLSLLETEIPSVVEKVKDAMMGLHKTLAKKTFKGAELLLKKLKQ